MPSTVAIVMALAGAALAQNLAIVENSCDFAIALNTAGGDIAPYGATLQPGDSWSTPLAGSGLSIQARKVQGGADNELDVTVDGTTIYYALGGNQGLDAFGADGLSIVPSDTTCPAIVCAPNDSSCPIGQTFACSTQSQPDITFTLCQ